MVKLARTVITIIISSPLIPPAASSSSSIIFSKSKYAQSTLINPHQLFTHPSIPSTHSIHSRLALTGSLCFGTASEAHQSWAPHET
jgi:hypothetical protein